MSKFKIFTIGCKVAQAETHRLRLMLERFGLREAAGGDAPDLCVVNSCAVTSAAGGKSRRLISKLARSYPNGKIILLGCYASFADQTLRAIPQVALIADHHRGIQSALEHFLLHTYSGKPDTSCGATTQGDTTCNTHIKASPGPKVKNKFPNRQSRHRAFVKVQDGCNASCTYCIIPHLRPKIQSAAPEEVLSEVRTLIEAGHQELVLCGIFLGAYGKPTTRKNRFLKFPGHPLADLIGEILQIPGLGRLRLSSLEPMDLTGELLNVLASSDKVAGHLHLPLQSGSDNILRRMGRQYRSGQFLAAAAAARKLIPDLALTTDVIVGFPGETDEDFQDTLTVCEQAGFMKIHIFPFSPRPGTPAWNWQDKMISGPVMEERLKRINNTEEVLARAFREKFRGRQVRVLVEEIEQKDGTCYCLGRADQYFRVRFPGKPEFDNQFHTVKIIFAEEEPLTAE
jgi:threonylcarbamoyladenosine tRNA methylthiotransferase MtaB